MHIDPDLIALLALGEELGTGSDEAHLQTCTLCADELAQLRRLTTMGRSLDPEWTIVSPDDSVWVGICAELGLDLESRSDDTRSHEPDLGSDDRRIVPVLTARAKLNAVDAAWSQASGSAQMIIDEHGRRVLEVDLDAHLPADRSPTGLVDPSGRPDQRQTLGILDDLHGLWTVARTIDLTAYSIIDISQQSLGDTDHSGHTIVRGEFAALAA